MPIYEYECVSCGYLFEKEQKITDSPVKRCPECKHKVERLISQTCFTLKGTGWYKTDYGKKNAS